MTIRCPFCGLDPFEYVDVGVGYVPVAVTCCDLGYILYSHDKKQSRYAYKLLELRRSHSPRKKARYKRLLEQIP